MFSAAATIVLLAAARDLYAIVLLAALTGLTADLYRAPASALLADRIPIGQRLTAFTHYLRVFQFESTFALHVRDAGYSAATYGLLISLNGLLIILGELALTLITRKYVPIQVIAFGYLLVGVGFALNIAAPRPTVLILSVVIWTLGEMVSAPVFRHLRCRPRP